MKIASIVLLGLVLLIGGGFLLRVILFPVNTLNKQVDIMYGAQERVLNADNAIYNYEWFKRQHQAIEASKRQLDNAKASRDEFYAFVESRDSWSYEEGVEASRLRSVVLGIENNLEAQIGEYNARASMATRNIFADGVLPSFIDALTFIRK